METRLLSRYLLASCVSMVSMVAVAQTDTVNGVVKDQDGLELIGATVVVKGTTHGTITDFNGQFVLNEVPAGSTLEISYVGYVSQDIKYTGQKNLVIELQPSFTALDEVIAVGYEMKKKSVVTGAIGSVNSDDLGQAKPANVLSALNGRVSGVNVTTSSGQPGSTPKLIIRGVGTNGNSNPLYVIDGLPMGDMNSVNPSDIESLEVLKDATSAAIYGSRASNGVVLITTKKGKKGESSLTYDGYYGINRAQHIPDMMNAQEYVTMVNEFARNDGNSAVPDGVTGELTGHDVNWFDELFNEAPVMQHNLTASFGSDKGSSLLSINTLNQNGIIGENESQFNRYTVRLNSSYDINKYVRIGVNTNYVNSSSRGVSMGTNGWNPVQYAFNMEPTIPVLDPDSDDSLGYGTSDTGYGRMWNPLAFLGQSGQAINTTNHFYGNVFAEVTLLKNLIFKTDYGIDHKNTQRRQFAKAFYHTGMNNNPKSGVSQNSSHSENWQWENTLRYQFEVGKNQVSLLAGTSASEDYYESLSGSRNNMPEEAIGNEAYWYLDAGDVMTSTNSGSASAVHTMFSYFGRASYNYDERYMAEFVIRRDGSSNFGPQNKFGTFPGASLGWNVSRESFWKIRNFDSFKLRGSWGRNGNERISPFSYTAVVGNNYSYTFGDTPSVSVGSAPNNLVNPNVKWETSEQTNLGADMMFLGGAITASVDWFDKRTKDLLFRPSVESVYGNEAAYQNLGEISNKGWEFQTTGHLNAGDLNLSLSLNASYLKNEVIKIGNTNGYLDGGFWRETTNITRMEEGYPMGYFHLYKTDGVFATQAEADAYKNADGAKIQPEAQAGDLKWVDINGDGEITDADRTDCGNPWPKWTFGANLTAAYKGLDLTMFLSGKADYKIFGAHYRNEGYGKMNLPTFYLDRWQKEGDVTNIPRFSVKDPNGNYAKPSDFYLFDGSYLRISSLELGYSLPSSVLNKVLLKKARIYVAADNLATFTSYPFLDPEVGDMRSSGNNVLENGVDYGVYPMASTFRLGVQINF